MFRSMREDGMVMPGTRFQRQHTGAFTELAEVLWVNDGPTGIPHVHYVVHFGQMGADRVMNTSKERRTLSLAAFRHRYRDPAIA